MPHDPAEPQGHGLADPRLFTGRPEVADRLDDAFSAQRRERRTAENLRWVLGQAGEALAETGARAGRLLEEGGQAIIRGAQRAVAGRPAQPGVAKSGLPELGELGKAALDVAGGMGTGLGVINPVLNQPALEQALVGAGVSEELARQGAGILSTVGAPIAAAKIPVIAAALGRGTLTAEVAREIIGVPKGPGAPKAPEAVEPPIRPPEAGPAVNEPVQVVKPRTREELDTLVAQDPSALVAGDRAFQVNWATLGADQIDPTLDRITKAFAKEIEEARRGIIPDTTLRKLAQALDEPVETLLAQPPGTVVNAERMTVLVDALDSASTQLDDVIARTMAGDPQAAAVLHPLAEAVIALTVRTQAGFSELGRGLRVGRNRPAQLKGTQAAVERLTAQAGANLRGIEPAKLAEILHDLSKGERTKVLRQAPKPGFLDMVLEYRYGAMLSGLRTQVRNTLGSVAMTIGAIPERKVAEWLHFGPTPGVVQGEARAMAGALVHSTVDAMRLAAKAFRTGESQFSPFQTETRPGPAITAENVAALPGVGALTKVPGISQGVDLFGAAVRTTTRTMGSIDELFKAINFRMELHAQAVREATREGLTGKAYATRVGEIVADFERFSEIKANAQSFAAYQTFTDPLGPFSRAIQDLRELDHPAALAFKVVLPFFRTPVNIYRRLGERTLLPTLKLLHRSTRDDLLAGGPQRDLALARMTWGSLLLGAAATLANSSLVTGRGPADPRVRRNWERAGWQPYSWWNGKAWVSYQPLEPVGSVFGMGATMVELMANSADQEAIDRLDDLGVAYVLSIMQGMNAKSFLKGPADIFEAIYEGKSPGELAGDVAGSFVPVLATDLKRLFDPVMRDVRTMTDEVYAKTPGFGGVPPFVNPLNGEIVVYGGAWGPDFGNPFWSRTPSTDPVLLEVARLNLTLDRPRRDLAGVPLEDGEYFRYAVLSGRAFHERAMDEVTSPDWGEMSDDFKAERLEGAMATARREAVMDLREEFPALDTRLETYGDERLEFLYGGPGPRRLSPAGGGRRRQP